jgi:hypothetical protein
MIRYNIMEYSISCIVAQLVVLVVQFLVALLQRKLYMCRLTKVIFHQRQNYKYYETSPTTVRSWPYAITTNKEKNVGNRESPRQARGQLQKTIVQDRSQILAVVCTYWCSQHQPIPYKHRFTCSMKRPCMLFHRHKITMANRICSTSIGDLDHNRHICQHSHDRKA